MLGQLIGCKGLRIHNKIHASMDLFWTFAFKQLENSSTSLYHSLWNYECMFTFLDVVSLLCTLDKGVRNIIGHGDGCSGF